MLTDTLVNCTYCFYCTRLIRAPRTHSTTPSRAFCASHQLTAEQCCYFCYSPLFFFPPRTPSLDIDTVYQWVARTRGDINVFSVTLTRRAAGYFRDANKLRRSRFLSNQSPAPELWRGQTRVADAPPLSYRSRVAMSNLIWKLMDLVLSRLKHKKAAQKSSGLKVFSLVLDSNGSRVHQINDWKTGNSPEAGMWHHLFKRDGGKKKKKKLSSTETRLKYWADTRKCSDQNVPKKGKHYIQHHKGSQTT